MLPLALYRFRRSFRRREARDTPQVRVEGDDGPLVRALCACLASQVALVVLAATFKLPFLSEAASRLQNFSYYGTIAGEWRIGDRKCK